MEWCCGRYCWNFSLPCPSALCFLVLSFSLLSSCLSDPSVSSQPVHCGRATSSTGIDRAMLSLPVAQDSQDCSSAPTASLSTRCEPGPPQDPTSPCPRTCGAEKPPLDERDPTHCSPPQEPETPEPECMIDSQPILFSENPFVVANRRGKAAGGACLGGPPLGYGREGVLKTNLYTKASALTACSMQSPGSPSAPTKPRGVQRQHEAWAAPTLMHVLCVWCLWLSSSTNGPAVHVPSARRPRWGAGEDLPSVWAAPPGASSVAVVLWEQRAAG